MAGMDRHGRSMPAFFIPFPVHAGILEGMCLGIEWHKPTKLDVEHAPV